MKIFSLRNLLGVGAIYAATQYAKKNGGARPAFEGLLAKVRDAVTMKKDELSGKVHDASVEPAAAQSSGYRGSDSSSNDLGGNGSSRRS